MTKRTFVLVIFLTGFFVAEFSLAQGNPLFVPLNVRQSYNKGIRTIDGKPGVNYWQNQSDYKINVELFPENRLIEGNETIVYYNNSPDSLDYLYIRLYQDIFKKGNARDFVIDTSDITGGVSIKELKVNGSEVQYDRVGTNLQIKMSNKIAPSSTVPIKVVWSFVLPAKVKLRMGAYSPTAFFVGQWYPQMAVYDDIDGWDKLNYGGTVEFYNDFSNFDVSITAPAGFIVWATGVLQNPSDVLEKQYLARFDKAHNSKDIVKIIGPADSNAIKITKGKIKNTWNYKAANVPDFAFGVAKNYLWDACSFVVDKTTDRKAFVSAAYNPNSKDFYEVAEVAKRSIEYLSFDLPGVPYPYPTMTVFNGNGGMEYPMMVNDGSGPKRVGMVHVTSHEIAHTYFPFYMGINERKYAFMDEGMATMLPFKYQMTEEPGYLPIQGNCQSFAQFSGSEAEMPLMTPSYMLNGSPYRNSAYRRPGVAYYVLQDMIGEDNFRDVMRKYIEGWNGKHPIPYDFFYLVNSATQQNLNWFWKPWFFEKAYPDLSIIDAIRIDEDTYSVTVENIGGLPLPISLKTIYGSPGSVDSIYLKANIWEKGNKRVTVNITAKTGAKEFVLGSSLIPDINLIDNKLVISK